MPEILDLISHIVNSSAEEYRYHENRVFFNVGNHIAEYSSTRIMPKEHKLWHTEKAYDYICFIMFQRYGNYRDERYRNKIIIHHVLQDIQNICRNNYEISLPLTFVPKKTRASARGAMDQFEESAIAIDMQGSVDIENIADLIIDITDITYNRNLHLRRGR